MKKALKTGRTRRRPVVTYAGAVAVVLAVGHLPVRADSGPALGALQFDGTDDFVQIPNSASLSLDSLTLEAWVYLSSPVSFNPGVVIGKGTPTGYGNYTMMINGTGEFPSQTFSYVQDVSQGNASTAGGFIPANTWTQIAATYSAGVQTTYVNGVLVNSWNTSPSPVQNLSDILIGAHPGSSFPAPYDKMFFSGEIDEVRIWNVARTPAQIAANYNRVISGSTPGLVAYYNFDEPSGQYVYDLSGHGNTGTLGSTSAIGIDDPTRVASSVPLLMPTVQTQVVNRTPATTLTTVVAPHVTQVVPIQGTLVTVTNPSLMVYSNGTFISGGTIDQSKPTIVLTHGWNENSSDTWDTFAHQIQPDDPSANIIAWNWSGNADTGILQLGLATSRTNSEGTALGHALVLALGPGYNQDIHFFGHSLGTLVNGQAVNVFEASEHDNSNTQVTIFDDAEAANGYTTAGTSFATSVPAVLVSHIDNYISSFGTLKLIGNATNVILDSSQSTDLLGIHGIELFHGYPIDWYISTISLGGFSGQIPPVGYAWAVENPRNIGFPNNQFYAQGASPADPLVLSAIDQASATSKLSQRDNGIMTNAFGILNVLSNPTMQVVGNVSTSVGLISGSLTADLTAVLGGGSAAHASEGGSLSPAVTSPTASPSYAWMKLHIPINAQSISLDFTFNGVDPNDLLIVGINDTQLFALEGAYVPDGFTENTGFLDVSAWADQDVELFLGNTGIASNGTMSVNNIMIQSTPAPEPANVGVLAVGILFLIVRRRKHV